MKRNLSSISYLLLLINLSFSQAPEIEWQNIIGGDEGESIGKIMQTPDGGYIIGGSSGSGISGDKTESLIGYSDCWIFKLNSAGDILWQNAIGGSGSETIYCLDVTNDGGFILGCSSNSAISGDKTSNSKGGYDYWIIKLDSVGGIVWQKTIGGSGSDTPISINQTEDGGYIVGGQSNSMISGDKLEGAIGGPTFADYWVLKLNNVGDIEWQNTIGGTNRDDLTAIRQTTDGGYIISGHSWSSISGDKIEGVMGVGSLNDYWVIKLDNSGNIVWQNTIGGTGGDFLFDVIQTTDGGYILFGDSDSGISFDKTDVSNGWKDYWILKLDEVGNIIWQKTIGGNQIDYLYSGVETPDGGFVLAGNSRSDISGDKTGVFFGGSYYGDYWIVKIDSLGEILWQTTLGGNTEEFPANIIQTTDGGFIVSGVSNSTISGNITENNWDLVYPWSYDFWIVKLFPDCTPSPELCNSLDDNCNGLIDDAITETISISAGGPITFCQGGNVLLTATYSGATVQWKKNGVNIPGATSPTYLVTTKATYTCTTTSPCGTATSAGIFVNVNKNPAASITAGGATTFCAGGSVVLTANAGGGLSYQWYKGASLIAGATSINYTATLAGNYKCRVTKTATGCFKNSNVISVSVPCKEGEMVDVENTFNIYPNPNDGTFTIEAVVKTQDFASPESTIEIYNNLGQLIFTKKVFASDGTIHETIKLNNSNFGSYAILLIKDGMILIQNFIIE